MQKKILIINGPNINMLGLRETEIYGTKNYETLMHECKMLAQQANIALEHFQSNHEGAIVDKIQTITTDNFSDIIINPGAYTHTSIAIRDALLIVSSTIHIYEVHISNIFQRENFRHHSYISDIATAVLSGFGSNGYKLAIQHIVNPSQ